VSGATIVVPCGQESGRIDAGAFTRLLSARPGLRLLLVDHGASDGMKRALDALAESSPDRVSVHSVARNLGTGEAVRQGLVAALTRADDDVFGHVDSGLSTPPAEIVRLLDMIARRHADVVLPSRVAMLGCEIERSPVRHYLGRTFATLASNILRVRVYDTQCAAKFFRRSDALAAALATPFVSQLAFDVELLGRLLIGAPGVPPLSPERFIEEPLTSWRDRSGYRVRPVSMAIAARDLILIAKDLAARRARPARDPCHCQEI
jgi:glycosyltransferase involved in cell wall biosynthesis